jgi:hypothetical protein
MIGATVNLQSLGQQETRCDAREPEGREENEKPAPAPQLE